MGWEGGFRIGIRRFLQKIHALRNGGGIKGVFPCFYAFKFA